MKFQIKNYFAFDWITYFLGNYNLLNNITEYTFYILEEGKKGPLQFFERNSGGHE